MSITSRRGFLGAMAVSGATLAASRAAAAPAKLDLAPLLGPEPLLLAPAGDDHLARTAAQSLQEGS